MALLWKDETEGVQYAKEAVDFISTLSEESLLNFLLMGRFDKNLTKLSFSIILGDEGGFFALINKVPPGSKQEKFVLNSGVSKKFLLEKREKQNDKVILGKGSFGKVRLAACISGSLKADIGQLVCVKKSLQIGEKKTREMNLLKNITDSTMEDFFAQKLNDSIHSPMPLDMAILNSYLNKNKHRKGYLFMELVPENTADKIFGEKNYQKWEYQKPFILAVLKTTNEMLLKNRIFNSDLKPQNTLFDPLSRKMAIIDLGSSLLINKDQDFEKFDASAGGFGTSQPYCPPEINDEDSLEKLNLKKAISYLCGVTIAEVTCSVPGDFKAKKNFENWKLTAEYTDLDKQSKNSLIVTIKSLTDKNPLLRMDVNDAIESIEKIGLKADEIMKKATAEQYIQKLRKVINENPSVLSLNEDILDTRKKGIIKQMVVESNPKNYKHQKMKELNKEMEDFMKNDVKEDERKHLVLLGEAGSGKSLALQLRFIKEAEEWQYGKHALPLYFNMADEVNLEKVVNRLNAKLGCNIKLEDPSSEEIHLFIDSYDEGEMGIIENKKLSGNNLSIIEQYFERLRKWTKIKFVISCKTDFVQREGEENLSEFQVRSSLGNTLCVRYIAPVDYQIAKKNSNNEKTGFDVQVKEWLIRENRKEKPEEIIGLLKKLALEGRMRTGLLFNMIMKMTLNLQKENLNDLRLKGFEIYSRTIKEEFRLNWQKVVSGKRSGVKESDKEKGQFAEIKELIQKRLPGVDDGENKDKKFSERDYFEVIWEGMERIGEMIAAEMSLNKSNRVRYSDCERLLLEQTGKNKDEEYESDVKAEWKTLYQMFRIMGLKLEKRNIVIEKRDDEKGDLNKFGEESIIDIGFRHETYKNYYLLRGLKRLLPVVLREMGADDSGVNTKASNDAEKIHSNKIVAALLEDQGLISNYELLRFCGEEVQNYKDPSLREGLRKMLSLEQKKHREGKNHEIKKAQLTSSMCPFEDKEERVPKMSRSAGVMSLLVAGRYQFWGEDLGDLDLAGAYMRGGTFAGANLKELALLVNSDLRALQLGVWPDLIGHYEAVLSVTFSPDGKKVASGSRDYSVKIWDSGSGECMQTLLGHAGGVSSVVFSPDGKKIASGSDDKSVKIWDSVSGECLQTLVGHSGIVISASFSPDGKNVTTGSKDRSIKIWDIGSGKCLHTLVGHSDTVRSVSFSPEGNKVASGSDDESVKIWDSGSGKCLQTLSGHSATVFAVSFSHDGKKIVSGSDDRTIKIWDSGSGKCVQTLAGHTLIVRSVKFSPDGKKVVSASDDRSVKIWDSGSGECLQTLAGHSGIVFSASFSPDGKKVTSGSDDRSVKIWDSGSGGSVQTVAGHSRAVSSVSFSSEGKKVASGSDDNTIKIWDSGSGECLQTLAGHSGRVCSVSFSSDGKKVASGSEDDRSVKIWDIGSGECVNTLALSGRVCSVNFSPDGKRLASADRSTIKIWDSGSGKCLQTLARPGVLSVSFSPDGKKVASGNDDRSVIIWDCGSSESVLTMTGHTAKVNSVSFSPDGKKVASGSDDRSVKIWDSGSGQCLQTLAGHSGWVCSVNFSPDGKKFASGDIDRLIKIWDSGSGECVQTLAGHSGTVNSVNFSPDGKKLATGSSDNTVKIWDSSSGVHLETFEGIANTNAVFQKKSIEEIPFLLKWSSDESEFKCESTGIIGCFMDAKNNELDNWNEIIVKQRKGIIFM